MLQETWLGREKCAQRKKSGFFWSFWLNVVWQKAGGYQSCHDSLRILGWQFSSLTFSCCFVPYTCWGQKVYVLQTSTQTFWFSFVTNHHNSSLCSFCAQWRKEGQGLTLSLSNSKEKFPISQFLAKFPTGVVIVWTLKFAPALGIRIFVLGLDSPFLTHVLGNKSKISFCAQRMWNWVSLPLSGVLLLPGGQVTAGNLWYHVCCASLVVGHFPDFFHTVVGQAI